MVRYLENVDSASVLLVAVGHVDAARADHQYLHTSTMERSWKAHWDRWAWRYFRYHGMKAWRHHSSSANRCNSYSGITRILVKKRFEIFWKTPREASQVNKSSASVWCSVKFMAGWLFTAVYDMPAPAFLVQHTEGPSRHCCRAKVSGARLTQRWIWPVTVWYQYATKMRCCWARPRTNTNSTNENNKSSRTYTPVSEHDRTST